MFVLLLAFAAFAGAVNVHHYDHVVIGGGGGGCMAATALKDNGYSVAVLEIENRLGGHCNTEKISEAPGWVDLGVVAYIRTKVINEMGFGNFSIDMEAHVKRFANISYFSASGILPYFTADLQAEVGVSAAGPPPVTAEDIVELANFLNTNYSFTKQPTYPRHFPAELNVSIIEYINTHPYIQPFAHHLAEMCKVGALKLESTKMMYLLKELAIYLMAAVQDGLLFMVQGGCQTMYDGIYDYLMDAPQRGVFLNANVIRITRPAAGASGHVVILFEMDGKNHLITADNIVIAISPTLDNLPFLTLDAVEHAALSPVAPNPLAYSTMLLQVNYSSAPVVSIVNLNNSANLYEPPDGLIDVFQGDAVGKNFIGLATTNVASAMTIDQTTMLVNEGLVRLANLPSPVDAKLVKIYEHFGYFPHMPDGDIGALYDAVYQLQGRRFLYFCGALFPYPDTTLIGDACHQLLNAHFPPKPTGSR